MITVDYMRTMASYNSWQNENLYGAAGTLTDAQRKEQRAPSSARSMARSIICSGVIRCG